jgi:tetratricopeptide (TPR) repeat protein
VFLDQAATFWERSGRIVLSVVGVAAVLAAVTILALRARASAENDAASKLAEADIMFWQGYYPRSLTAARQVAQQFPNTPSGLDAHRLAGDAAYWTGDFKTAVTEYRTYIAKDSHGLLADAARRSLAYSLESSGEYDEAARIYESLVGTFERESSAEFLYAAARCRRHQNRVDEAVKDLQRVVNEFADTSVANRARIALAELGRS